MIGPWELTKEPNRSGKWSFLKYEYVPHDAQARCLTILWLCFVWVRR